MLTSYTADAARYLAAAAQARRDVAALKARLAADPDAPAHTIRDRQHKAERRADWARSHLAWARRANRQARTYSRADAFLREAHRLEAQGETLLAAFARNKARSLFEKADAIPFPQE